ncbi:MAG: fumarylacetoacetate hydrolase family protein [Mailhella sp.]|nr:fumarylacetoacetate hydrolase family protein [Mailhella sp.]
MKIARIAFAGDTLFTAVLPDGSYEALGGKRIPRDAARLLCPAAPGKIIAAGLNYHAHAAELGWPRPEAPAFFLKPPSSLIGDGETIIMPTGVGRVDYEAELALVIARECRNVNEAQAPEYIFGYTCANDVTARDLQAQSQMFGRCKGYDTFCPLGPYIETNPPSPDAAIKTMVNGEVRQEGRIGEMIASPARLVSFISSVMTLKKGDVILTGTPSGIGPILPGDTVSVSIDGIGTLSNPVKTR